MKDSTINILKNSLLFRGMDSDEIIGFLKNSSSFITSYEKNEIIFDMNEKPEYLFVLLKGAITVNRDSLSGKRTVVTTIDEVGDIFAEVYLFLPKEEYDYYTMATTNKTEILKIPKSAFESLGIGGYNQKIVTNMLLILSQKAYNLTQKLQILSSGGLRQKLSKMFLESMNAEGNVLLGFSREQMAEYLNVARPSLSRELANMDAEGLIKVNGREITILKAEELEEML